MTQAVSPGTLQTPQLRGQQQLTRLIPEKAANARNARGKRWPPDKPVFNSTDCNADVYSELKSTNGGEEKCLHKACKISPLLLSRKCRPTDTDLFSPCFPFWFLASKQTALWRKCTGLAFVQEHRSNFFFPFSSNVLCQHLLKTKMKLF